MAGPLTPFIPQAPNLIATILRQAQRGFGLTQAINRGQQAEIIPFPQDRVSQTPFQPPQMSERDQIAHDLQVHMQNERDRDIPDLDRFRKLQEADDVLQGRRPPTDIVEPSVTAGEGIAGTELTDVETGSTRISSPSLGEDANIDFRRATDKWIRLRTEGGGLPDPRNPSIGEAERKNMRLEALQKLRMEEDFNILPPVSSEDGGTVLTNISPVVPRPDAPFIRLYTNPRTNKSLIEYQWEDGRVAHIPFDTRFEAMGQVRDAFENNNTPAFDRMALNGQRQRMKMELQRSSDILLDSPPTVAPIKGQSSDIADSFDIELPSGEEARFDILETSDTRSDARGVEGEKVFDISFSTGGSNFKKFGQGGSPITLDNRDTMALFDQVRRQTDALIRREKPGRIVFDANEDIKLPLYKRFAQAIAKKHGGTMTERKEGVFWIDFKRPQN